MNGIDRGLIVVDGSHLFASIYRIWKDRPELNKHKLQVDKLTHYLFEYWGQYMSSTIRTTYYFKKQDKRLKTMLEIPKISNPVSKNHWQINECAESSGNNIPESQLERLDSKYRDQFHRSEKGLDMELACDTLQLVARGNVNCVVFLVNDRDYIPLFKTIQRLGGNTYLTALDSKQSVQSQLLDLADVYQTFDRHLNKIFGYKPPQNKQ